MAEILVTENITGGAMTRLRETHDVAFEPDLWSNTELVSKLAEARAVIVRNQTQITRELIEQSPRLEVIARAGAGLDNIDTTAAAEAGISLDHRVFCSGFTELGDQRFHCWKCGQYRCQLGNRLFRLCQCHRQY